MVSSIDLLENAEKVLDKRRGESKTYTIALPTDDPEAIRFQLDFFENQLSKSKDLLEMKDELQKFPETLQEHYRMLVPDVVSFGDFFCRYYYRCNLDRIMDELRQQK